MTRDAGLKAPRHLRWEAFEARIRGGPPSVEPVAGTPRVLLFIEPLGARIGVRVASKPDILPASPLAEVAVREVGDGTGRLVEVSTSNASLFRDFYSFCCTIADRVQLDGQPVEQALTDTLQSWSALIRRKMLLSEDRQLGLLGELTVLLRLADRHGWQAATDAWRGPDSEEHDFTLPKRDLEVKTTRTERRVHHIGSLTQLVPKLKRPLVLLSVQLTSGARASEAFSLPEMISRVLNAAASGSSKATHSIRERLGKAGWVDEDAALYGERYQARSPLMAILVDAAFPAIVPETLGSLGAHQLARIERVSYFINVDGLGVSDGSPEFEALIFGK